MPSFFLSRRPCFIFLLLALLLWTDVRAALSAEHTFAIGPESFLLDGKPFVIRCGEIHFARVPREYWQHRLKMAKAMGLNTVCVYLFWNFHEWEQGKYDWSGQADVAEFCRLAQREGLWVLLRPGPYSCAEWEMGGLPWWLLKNEKISMRSTDPAFLEPAVRYLKEVGRVLGPLQVTHGGPLLMAQVENEYGSFGHDAAYMGALRQALIDGGFDVPLFACNPPGDLAKGYRPDLFQVVNFGANAGGKAFEALRKIQPTGPLMNGEYYPAWFDVWGRKHATGAAAPIVADLQAMLQAGRSFSIYMAHGGTSFGLWAGADRPFRPDTSSYDYDAPISEAGWVTPKFTAIREVLGRHLLPGETLPEPPPPNPVVTFPAVELTEAAPVMENLPAPVGAGGAPRTMEAYNQSRGDVVYCTTLASGPVGRLQVKEVHDFAWVFLDGKLCGVLDRRGGRNFVDLPARTAPARLDIFLETMGRVNFGVEVSDRKGLHGPVKFTMEGKPDEELGGWQVFPLTLDAAELGALKFRPVANTVPAPAFWRGGFDLEKAGDTFLDVRTLGKGVLWVNGHCLGRFWNIGPTQTMYCPGPWLRAGHNDVTVLDVIGPPRPQIAGLAQPILDQLRPELDFARRVRASGTFSAEGIAPAATGSFTPAVQWQETHFASPVKGRYLCLEALNAHGGGRTAALAELDALDDRGANIPKTGWHILWADNEASSAENVLDGQSASSWITEKSPGSPDFPHRVVIDLGESRTVGGIRCLPRAGGPEEVGRVKDYRVYVSDRPFGLVPP